MFAKVSAFFLKSHSLKVLKDWKRAYHVCVIVRGLPAEVWCWGGFYMYGPSYRLPSYNSLWWAAQSLTWPWLLCVCHWGDLIRGEAARIPRSWKIEIWGAERERGDGGKWPLTFDSPSKLSYSSEFKSSFCNICFICTIIKVSETTVCVMLHSRP